MQPQNRRQALLTCRDVEVVAHEQPIAYDSSRQHQQTWGIIRVHEFQPATKEKPSAGSMTSASASINTQHVEDLPPDIAEPKGDVWQPPFPCDVGSHCLILLSEKPQPSIEDDDIVELAHRAIGVLPRLDRLATPQAGHAIQLCWQREVERPCCSEAKTAEAGKQQAQQPSGAAC